MRVSVEGEDEYVLECVLECVKGESGGCFVIVDCRYAHVSLVERELNSYDMHLSYSSS